MIEKLNSIEEYPEQGNHAGRFVTVIFGYSLDGPYYPGRIIRDDINKPYLTIIQLDNGKVVEAAECQYTLSRNVGSNGR